MAEKKMATDAKDYQYRKTYQSGAISTFTANSSCREDSHREISPTGSHDILYVKGSMLCEVTGHCNFRFVIAAGCTIVSSFASASFVGNK
jgi:hydroxyethylthiazole kinase-like sugar kinase family protein